MFETESQLKTEQILVHMGPQHPATHGVFRLDLVVDGEICVKAIPVVGYLHRGIEKIAETRDWTKIIPYTDRLDYIAAMTNNFGYVQAVEKLLGNVEVPERAEYIRVIASELQRLASHMLFTGVYAIDIGAITPLFYCLGDREIIMEFFTSLCGARLTTNYARIGGVAHDLPDGWLESVKEFIDDLPRRIDEYDRLISGNEIFQARTRGVGILDPQTAINWGVTGCVLRGSGVNYDVRKAKPYGIYDRFDFNVPLGENCDSYDRYRLRIFEMYESVKIIQQAIESIPDGPIQAKVPKVIKPPAGEVYHSIEAPRGDLGYYLVSEGGTTPVRMHVRSPGFINLATLQFLCNGGLIADAVAIMGSLDFMLGEVDR